MKTLFERFKRICSVRAAKAPEGVTATFTLRHKSLKIGDLHVEDGLWTFKYSEEFKHQDHLRSMVEFPDVNKTYTARNLWPFFAMRVPSLKQTRIRSIIDAEKIKDDDEVALLQRFGKRTISNPFELEKVTA